ncbi:K(+)-transporting ATPase subunit F [Bradyrhizobium betae]|uniref:K(+)-transporting ATPase subunit F n=1 Tax=Bradyrhizobium betae TaxID=244734 RepID=UPI003D666C8E
MIFDYSLAGAVSLALLFYLTYALLRPEAFLTVLLLVELLLADAVLVACLLALLLPLLRRTQSLKG